MLNIKGLVVNAGRKEILKGVDMKIETGSINAVMGVNGCGKSTLLNSIFSHPAYKIKAGQVEYDNENLLSLRAEEIATKGIFISYQTPPDFMEMTGMECVLLLERIFGEEMDEVHFMKKYSHELASLKITEEMLDRPLNVGFSGGERKRMEILQLLVAKPHTILLDEIDTGLDVDNLILIGNTLKDYVAAKKATVIIVTHYLRFLDFLKPDKVFVMNEGRVVKDGGFELADTIDKKGYSSIL